MESKSKILFAYPILYRDGMSKEEMCIPAPFFTEFEEGSTQTIALSVGYSLKLSKRCYILVNVDKIGEEKDFVNLDEDGRHETLRIGYFNNNLGVFVTAFFIKDVKISTSGFYEILVTIYDADEDGNKTDRIIDRYSSEFYVQAKKA